MSLVLHTVKELRGYIDKRLEKDMDFLLNIDGHRGMGKSCLAYYLGSEGDTDYSISKNFAFRKGKDEIEAKHLALKRYKWLNVDEGQRSFFNLSFMDPTQIALWKFYNEQRKSNICTTWCTPDFFKLGSAMVGITDMRIHVVARGVGVVFWPYENAVGFDRWQLKECQKIFREQTSGMTAAEITPEKKIEIYMQFPTYYGLIKWPDWPADVKKDYLRLDAEAKAEARAEEDVTSDARRDYLNFAKLASAVNETSPIFTQTLIARLARVSPNYVSEAIQYIRRSNRNKPNSVPIEVAQGRLETELNQNG